MKEPVFVLMIGLFFLSGCIGGTDNFGELSEPIGHETSKYDNGIAFEYPSFCKLEEDNDGFGEEVVRCDCAGFNTDIQFRKETLPSSLDAEQQEKAIDAMENEAGKDLFGETEDYKFGSYSAKTRSGKINILGKESEFEHGLIFCPTKTVQFMKSSTNDTISSDIIDLIESSFKCADEGVESPIDVSGKSKTPETSLLQFCEKSIFPKACAALVKEDASLCEDAENVSSCYSELAAITKNPGLCETIEGQNYSNSCYLGVAEAMNDQELCNRLDEGRRNTCIFRLAIQTLDYSLCSDLEDSTSQLCYVKIATELGNLSLCNNAIGTTRSRCIALINKDITACESEPYPEICIADINTKLALSKKDASYCNKIDIFGLLNDSVAGYPEIMDAQNCYSQVAIAAGEPEICEKIQTGFIKETCYAHVAIGLNNPELCEKYGKAPNRCYYDAVLATKKVS